MEGLGDRLVVRLRCSDRAGGGPGGRRRPARAGQCSGRFCRFQIGAGQRRRPGDRGEERRGELGPLGWARSAGPARLGPLGWAGRWPARLARPAGPLGWPARLVCSAGPVGWPAQLAPVSWPAQLAPVSWPGRLARSAGPLGRTTGLARSDGRAPCPAWIAAARVCSGPTTGTGARKAPGSRDMHLCWVTSRPPRRSSPQRVAWTRKTRRGGLPG